MNERLLKEIGTAKDLSKAHNKPVATVQELQTTVQKQNEQIKHAIEQRDRSSSALVTIQDISTSAKADSESVSKIKAELDALVSRVTDYSAAADETKVKVDRINSEIKQYTHKLEATVSG